MSNVQHCRTPRACLPATLQRLLRSQAESDAWRPLLPAAWTQDNIWLFIHLAPSHLQIPTISILYLYTILQISTIPYIYLIFVSGVCLYTYRDMHIEISSIIGPQIFRYLDIQIEATDCGNLDTGNRRGRRSLFSNLLSKCQNIYLKLFMRFILKNVRKTKNMYSTHCTGSIYLNILKFILNQQPAEHQQSIFFFECRYKYLDIRGQTVK